MPIQGRCHCGATRFGIDVLPKAVTRCTCSLCTKRGALWSSTTPEHIRLLTPRAAHATNRWQLKTVAHHFCPTCGCTTFTESPDWSKGEPDFDSPRIAVNAWVLDDADIAALPLTVIDGRNLW